ncbi:MAG: DHH family phosphoesterase [Candidatus Omnitrophica bacterium]|nr:DHH family phosphoesterase [Candidatus Omnitrophota bacterium]
MKNLKMIWQIKEVNKDLEGRLSKELGVSRILSRILINRGITTKRRGEKFLHPSLENLANPFLLAGMEKAVGRIIKAKEKGEKVLIYGDYDVDGITAVSLCLIILKELGLNTNFYIPERLKEGYGLHQEAIRLAREQGIGLIITVDCGITNRKEVRFAKSLGIDLIITDHHLPEEEQRPEAFAIIDPACNKARVTPPPISGGFTPLEGVGPPDRGKGEEDFRELSGVGIVYKLMQALTKLPPSSILPLKGGGNRWG